MSKQRIVFMGTGDIALPSFSFLMEMDEVEVVALITQPDKPVGRKQILTAPAIKELALANDIPVMQPERAREKSFILELAELKPDVIVVMAYGQILSQELLDIPSTACINLHASLLPKYRGAACIQAAIDAGDSHTGITVMHVVKALDAGDIILKKEAAIGEQETAGELHDRLADIAPEALTEVMTQFANGSATREPQDENLVSYIPKLLREHGEIDWTQSAAALERRIRAYDPWPGTSTSFTDKKGRTRRLKIFPQVKVSEHTGKPGEVLSTDGVFCVACGEGSLRMNASDFMLSSPVVVGGLLGPS